jgi:hypothetical protein
MSVPTTFCSAPQAPPAEEDAAPATPTDNEDAGVAPAAKGDAKAALKRVKRERK